MKYIVGGPSTGKTKEMIRLSAENNVPILCESEARKVRLLEKASIYGYTIPVPIVFDEDVERNQEVYVDDIEKLLEHMLRCKVTKMSINLVNEGDLERL